MSPVSWQLKSVDGKEVTLSPGGSQRFMVLCFLGCECPLSRLYGPRLEVLQRRFTPQGVGFIGIDSNCQDSLDEIRDYGKKHGITFPLVKDVDNKLADQLGATRVSEVVVVDSWLKVRYRGRIDNQFQPGISRESSTRNDLAQALTELLEGRAVSVFETDPQGCLIGRVRTPAAGATVSYCHQVARILDRHCAECHRAGEIGPFAMTDYHEVVGWGEMMIETIDQGRMPPWHASPDHGSFVNARQMPEADKQLLREWVQSGMPYGDESQLPIASEMRKVSPVPDYDLVLAMRDRPYTIPATGVVDYQYFVVDPGLKEDCWVSAAEVMPGNRAVVHHAIVFIRPPDGTRLRGVSWLTAYVPGQTRFQRHSGLARRVPAGSKFVFQLHYTPNGQEQTDLTRVGMSFVPEEQVTQEVYTVIALDQEF